MTPPNDTVTSPTPIDIVGKLDMVGSVFAIMINNPEEVPPTVRLASMVMLRILRDRIAEAHGISHESQHESPPFLAECMAQELAEDDSNG